MIPPAVQVLLDLPRPVGRARGRLVERGPDQPSRDRVGAGGRAGRRPGAHRSVVTGWQRTHGIDDRKAAASLLVKRLGSIIAFPPTVAWMSWRRVPALRADGLWLRFEGGEPKRLAVPAPEVAVLEGDDLAGSDDIVVLGERELLDHLHATVYDDAMGTLIDGFHAGERTGRRHLWGNLALTAVNSALWCTHRADAWADGPRLLDTDRRLGRTIDVLPAERPDAGGLRHAPQDVLPGLRRRGPRHLRIVQPARPRRAHRRSHGAHR